MLDSSSIAWERQKVCGVDVYTHHKFAEHLLQLAENAEVHKTATFIGIVRDNLLEPIRICIGTKFGDWDQFTGAIKQILATELKEAVEQKEEQSRQIREMQAQIAILKQCTTNPPIAPDSPTKVIRASMNNFSISGESTNPPQSTRKRLFPDIPTRQ